MDMTKCTSENCMYKDACYRNHAESFEFQSYANFEYTCNENSGFDNFIKCESVYREGNGLKCGFH